MHRLEDGTRLEHEWLLQALRLVHETEGVSEQELTDVAMYLFPLLEQIEPRPPPS